jgi:hypothetical protein
MRWQRKDERPKQDPPINARFVAAAAVTRELRVVRLGFQAGRLDVELSIQCGILRNQRRVEQTAQRNLLGRAW